ncbi:MAG: N-acetylmuramoyl-L-alanine amidase [Firmicutes bacterium]|nr:N-acetylmuramoyl-L-alanine amidase [Bacillota bacterium]
MGLFRRRGGIYLRSSALASLLMVALYFFTGGILGNSEDDSSARQAPSAELSAPGSITSGSVAGKTIVIDPGHGGGNPGTVGIGPEPEKDIVLDIAYNVKAMLEQAGARVVMTRTGDYDPGLAASTGQLTARARTANATGADVFISIHANWNDNPRVRGVETYHYTNSGQGLARYLQRDVVAQTGFSDLGVKYGNFYVLRNTNMPAALVEVGFLSNKQEAALLASPQYKEKVARGIYYGLERYFAETAGR